MSDRRDGFVKAVMTGLLANSADTEADRNSYVDTAWDIADRMIDLDPDGIERFLTSAGEFTSALHVMTPGELAYIEESIENLGASKGPEPKPSGTHHATIPSDDIPETEKIDAFKWTPPEGTEPKPSTKADIPIPSDSMSGDFRDLTETSYAVFDENRAILMDSISGAEEDSKVLAVEVTGLLWEGLVKFGFSVKEIGIDVYEMST